MTGVLRVEREKARRIAHNCVSRLREFCKDIAVVGELLNDKSAYVSEIELQCVPDFSLGNLLEIELRRVVDEGDLLAMPDMRSTETCGVYAMPKLDIPGFYLLIHQVRRIENQYSSVQHPLKFVAGSETSRAAAVGVQVKTGEQYHRILDALDAAGTAGLTDKEMQMYCEMNGNSQRPRRIELEKTRQLVKKMENGKRVVRDGSGVWVHADHQFKKVGV